MPVLLAPRLATRQAVRMAVTSLLLTIMSLWLGCRPAANTAQTPEEKVQPPLEVAVLTVQTQPWPLIIRSQGVLMADETASVGTKVAGGVAKVHVELGNVGRMGDPLVELDSDEFQLHVAQAEAQLAQARSGIPPKK